MKYLPVYLCFLLFVSMNSAAQEKDTLTQKEFKELLKKEFYFLANSDAPTSISNFASLETKDGKVTLQTNFFLDRGIFENRDLILGIQANGAGSTESLPIYSENEFNSNIGVEVELKFPNYALAKIRNKNSKASIEYRDSEKTQRDINIRKIDEAYHVDTLNISAEKQSLVFDKQIVEKDLEIEKLEDEIITIQGKIDSNTSRIRSLIRDRALDGTLVDSLRRSVSIHEKSIVKKDWNKPKRLFKSMSLKLRSQT